MAYIGIIEYKRPGNIGGAIIEMRLNGYSCGED